MNVKKLNLLGIALAALLTGCASHTAYKISQADHDQASDFLPAHEKLQQQPPEFPFQLFYFNENAPVRKNIYFAPVDTDALRKASCWAELDKKLAGKLGDDVAKIANHMREEYVAEFNKVKYPNKPQVVDKPAAKDCLIVESAIIAIVPNKAELNVLGMAGNLIVPGVSLAVARLAAGSVTIECKVRDAETGELCAMYSATICDQAAVISLKTFSWFGSAMRSVERSAKYNAQVFATRDHGLVKRDKPYQFITW